MGDGLRDTKEELGPLRPLPTRTSTLLATGACGVVAGSVLSSHVLLSSSSVLLSLNWADGFQADTEPRWEPLTEGRPPQAPARALHPSDQFPLLSGPSLVWFSADLNCGNILHLWRSI